MFKFFTRKKKQKSVNNDISIPNRAPHTNLRPVDFTVPPSVDTLNKNFSNMINKFLKHANPDQFNETYMDEIIDSACAEALYDLRIQHDLHMETINISIPQVLRGDIITCESKLKYACEDMKKLKQELEECRYLRKQHNQGGVMYEK